MVARLQPRYELYVLLFPNNKRYFGISVDAVKRFQDHKASKRTFPVYNALRKNGFENVVMQVVCIGRRDYIRELEIACIAKFKTTDRRYGYNVTAGGESGPTPEMAAKISRTKMGHAVPAEVCAKISNSLVEYFKTCPDPIPPKHRAAINKSMKNRKKPPPFTLEHRANLRITTLQRGGAARMNTVEAHAKAEATKRAKREALLAAGLPLISEETRAKHRTYKPKQSTRAKTGASLKKYYDTHPGAHKNGPNYNPPPPFRGPHKGPARAKLREFWTLKKEVFATYDILMGPSGKPLRRAA